VNTARGQVIDETALAAALETGKIGAVGMGVYEHEPEVHPSLLQNKRALLLPLVGTYNTETLAMEC